ncbi:hypothetical protein ACF0H5_020430 [Mactra antiquata]
MDMNYDVAVIGGGVVGCAVTFELTRHGFSCLLLEKNSTLVSEASAGNSGMLHCGFDIKESTELQCIQKSQAHVFDVLNTFSVPLQRIGATMVAWNDEQLQKFPHVVKHANNVGVEDIQTLSLSDLYQKEPNLNRKALGGLYIPGECVTDPWLFPMLLMNDARHKGAKIFTDSLLESCHWDDKRWMLYTTQGLVKSKCIVNTAGLYGDIVDKLAGKNNFSIHPRKGQFTIYNKSSSHLINSSILPVPSDVGKGVIVFRSVYDNVIVGPTADQVERRVRPPIDDNLSHRLSTVAMETVPSLLQYKVDMKYTGLRPATEIKDYVIRSDNDKNWVTVGGIRSTGLSGCLGIAEMVRDFVQEDIRIEPSRGSCLVLDKPDVKSTTHGTVVIDTTEFTITHPLSMVGHAGQHSKL